MEGVKNRGYHRILFLGVSTLFAVTVFFSVMVAVTFAWKDLDQHVSATLTSANQGFSVLLQKEVKPDQAIQQSSILSGSYLYLYRVEDDDSMTQIGERLVTDASGQVFLNDLPAGNYCFIDSDPSYGYTWDTNDENENKIVYPFTLDLSTTENHMLLVTIYNKKLTSDLTIVNKSEDIAASFSYLVQFNETGSYYYKIGSTGEEGEIRSGESLTLKSGDTAKILGIPVGTAYKITQAANLRTIVNKTNFDDSIPLEGITAIFENIKSVPSGNTAPVTLQINKKVEGITTDKIFTLMAIIGDTENTVELKDGEKTEIPIPENVEWSVLEAGYWNEGFLTESSLKNVESADGTYIAEFTKVSKYFGGTERTISGEVTWNISLYPDATLPESIEVHLCDGEHIVQRVTVKPDSEGKWLYSFTVSEFRPDGVTAIDYTVDQAPVEGFGKTITGMDITNTPVSPVVQDIFFVKQSITVIGQPPASFPQFKYVLTTDDESTPLPEQTEVSITGEGQVDFGEVKFEKAGTYYYTITQTKGTAKGFSYDTSEFHVTVVVEASGAELVAGSTVYRRNDDREAYDHAFFKNEFVYETSDTTLVKANVQWRNDDPLERPESTELQLYCNGVPFGELVTLNDDNDWSYTWIQLDKKDEWTVAEPITPDGYEKETSQGEGENTFTIINALADDEELFQEDRLVLSGKIIWEHGTNQEPPSGVTVRIRNKEFIVDEKRVTSETDWEWSIELVKLDSNGEEISYVVEVEPISQYNSVVTGTDITMTFSEETEAIETVSQSNGEHDAPNTGDTTKDMILWVAMLAISSIIMKNILFKKRKRVYNG